MNLIAPPLARVPTSAPTDLLQYLVTLQQRVDQLSRLVMANGDGVGGTLPAFLPKSRTWCFGKIAEDGGSGGTSRARISGKATNFAGAGFYLPDGFLAYYFQQVYDEAPWQGVVVENGIETQLGTDGEVIDAAVPLNGEKYQVGDLVFLIRTFPHWTINNRVVNLRDIDLVCDDETGQATVIKTP